MELRYRLGEAVQRTEALSVIAMTTLLVTGTCAWPGSAIAVAGACVALATWAAALFAPFFVLTLLLAYVPFQTFVDFALPPAGSIWMGALIRDALVAMVILSWLVRRVGGLERHRWTRLPQVAVICYVCLMAVYVPFADSLAGALVSYRNLALYLLLLPASSDLVNTKSRLRTVVAVILGTSMIVGLLGVAEVLTSRRVFGWLGYDMEALMGSDLPFTYLGLARATGGTGNPLEFALHMAIAGVTAMAYASSGGSTSRRGYLAVVFGVVLLALALTFARSAYLSLLVGILTVALLLRRRWFLVALAVLVAVTVWLAQTPYGEMIGARVRLKDDPGITTVDQRIEVWRQVFTPGISLWSGSGLGTQGSATERAGTTPLLHITDNYYALIALQVGWGPLVLFLCMLVALLIGYLRFVHLRDDRELTAYAALCIAIVLMVVVNAGLSSALESRTISILVAILLGSGLNLAHFMPQAGAWNARPSR